MRLIWSGGITCVCLTENSGSCAGFPENGDDPQSAFPFAELQAYGRAELDFCGSRITLCKMSAEALKLARKPEKEGGGRRLRRRRFRTVGDRAENQAVFRLGAFETAPRSRLSIPTSRRQDTSPGHDRPEEIAGFFCRPQNSPSSSG